MHSYGNTRFDLEPNFDAYRRWHDYSCVRYYTEKELRRRFTELENAGVDIDRLPKDMKAHTIMNISTEEAKAYQVNKVKPSKKKVSITFTPAQLNQLEAIIGLAKKEGWYYGNKSQFYKRTEQLLDLIDQIKEAK